MTPSPEALNSPVLAVTGIYPDGWITSTASMELSQPSNGAVLRVRGMVPLTKDAAFHTTLEVRLDDEPFARRRLGIGNFDVSVPVPRAAGNRRVTLAFDGTQALPGQDGRQVSARLESIGFENTNPAGVHAAVDIVDDSRVSLGEGWGQRETFGGETFRWIANDAHLGVNLGAAHDAVVTLLLEPGPGAAGRPLLLRVLDASGRQVGAMVLDRRRTYRLPLPLKGSGGDVFQLHVEGGGALVPNDSRVMNFRAFAVEAKPWPP